MALTQNSLFVSYSHKDRDLVLALVRMQSDLWYASFIDFMHTPRGSDWANEHRVRIASSDRVLLFWSANAALSKQVEREWKYAKNARSRIIPILLDATPLPSELDSLHAVELRDLIQTEGVSHFIQSNFLNRSNHAKSLGIITIMISACATLSVPFLVPATDGAIILIDSLLMLFGFMWLVALSHLTREATNLI